MTGDLFARARGRVAPASVPVAPASVRVAPASVRVAPASVRVAPASVPAAAPELRPAQAQALAYSGGRLAISAAPGSGKTFILTRLAVHLVADLGVRPDQIVVLTYMRSAAATFRARASAELARRGIAARGLTASTIHSFCQRILRHDLGRFAGADDAGFAGDGGFFEGEESSGDAYDGAPGGREDGRFSVMADAEQHGILRRGMQAYLSDPDRAARFADRRRGRDPEDSRREAVEVARRAISAAKQTRRPPSQLADALAGTPEIGFLARYYHDHQRAMRLLDFDDLLVGAVARLRGNPALLAHFRLACRYLLEDEAQDSTPVQHELLDLLAGPDGNLVRVGDPNQAITSTFTHGRPGLFKDFCARTPVIYMAESGRSALPVIGLANRLAALTAGHPDPGVREAFGGAPIEPASSGQRNPEAEAGALAWQEYGGPEEEVARVVEGVRRHLRVHPGDTCAILCATNKLVRSADGAGYAPAARAAGLDVFQGGGDGAPAAQFLTVLHQAFQALDVLGATGGESAALRAFADLAVALAAHRGYRVAGAGALARAAGEIGLDRLVHSAGRPRPARAPGLAEADHFALIEAAEGLEAVADMRQLPLGDLCLGAAGALCPHDPAAPLVAAKVARLARAREIALGGGGRLRSATGTVRLTRELLDELAAGGRASRLLADAGETRSPGAGQVVITTLHKAKGAEYDAVWLPGLGAFSFPWEVADVWLPDEAAIIAGSLAAGEPGGAAALAAYRREYVGERLRLLYVGITRARRRLALSHAPSRRSPVPFHVLALVRECVP